MNYYQPCKYCGANLDPGETCDCRKEDELKLTNDGIKKMEDLYHGNNNQDSAARGINCRTQ